MITLAFTGNYQATQLALHNLHNSTQSDANRAIFCQALNTPLAAQSLGPKLDEYMQQAAATRVKAAGAAAPGPIIQALWADLQAIITNPAIEAAIIALLEKLLVPVTPAG